MTSKQPKLALGRRAKRLWASFKRLFRRPPPVEVALTPQFERVEEAIRSLRIEFSSQLSFHSYDLAEELQGVRTGFANEVKSQLDALQTQLGTLKTPLEALKARLETLKGGDELLPQVNALALGVQALNNASFELTNRVTGLDTGLNSRFNVADNKLFELDNKFATSAMELKTRLNEIESADVTRLAGAVAQMRDELRALGSQTVSSGAEGANHLAAAKTALLNRLNEIDNRAFEASNKLLHAQSESQSRLSELGFRTGEARNILEHLDSNLNSRLNEVLFVQLPAVLEQIHEAASLQIAALDDDNARKEGRPGRPQPIKSESFDAVLARARHDYPAVYNQWRERLDTMGSAFDETKVGNAAHAGDPYSRLFRSFVKRHTRGPVFDVGCGPFGRPYYLNGYPAKLISGLEPLPFPPNDDIQIVRGISEYVPFADGAFDTVISGTSLDHCLSLDRSLDEMFRVLASDGVLLLWLGHNPGSPPFKPLDPAFKPADQFHLFHFDIAWFEPMLGQRFEIVDRVKLDRAGYSHVFYALKPIPGSAPYDQSGAAIAKSAAPAGKGSKVPAGGVR